MREGNSKCAKDGSISNSKGGQPRNVHAWLRNEIDGVVFLLKGCTESKD